MKRMRQMKVWLAVIGIFCMLAFCVKPVNASDSFTVEATSNSGQTVTITINVEDTDVQIDGFEIYRAKDKKENFKLIHTIELSSGNTGSSYDDWYDFWEDWYNWNDSSTSDSLYSDSTDGNTYTYTDENGHAAFHKYYYRVKAYTLTYNEVTNTTDKTYQGTVTTSVRIKKDGPVIKKAKRSGQTGLVLQWKKQKNVDGYLVYMVKNYDAAGKKLDIDLTDESKYKLVKTVKGASKTKLTFQNKIHGVTYTYRVYSYKKINGKRVKSFSSEPASVLMDYYSCDESSEQKTKRVFGSEAAKEKNFATEAKADKQMTTISIKVWDFKNGKSGQKVTKIKYLTVNKNLASSIKAMFNEIYKSKEKQVIHDIGCYTYSGGEHRYGMAIDINPVENYMIDDGKVLAGSFWKPNSNAYSIPLDCDLVQIMERYGFYRGFWGNRKDYMHFSYFGT